ncbi:MAG TPA: hypothetical protein PLL20_15970 [Phycisphaerae bacterium]|nr:hypothetical protein [Phycisphaerae bacterium]HRR86069.1 hypothetical protein [Phycisphaerae bacterium]
MMTALARRIGYGLALAVVLAAGCAPIGTGAARQAARSTSATSQPEAKQDKAVDLRCLLIPSSLAQPVRIHVVEHRLTESAETGSTTQDVDLDLHALLRAVKVRDDGAVEATLRFVRIRMKVDAPQSSLAYDSENDKAGKGDQLADLMEAVTDAELTLLVSPDGRLLELRGLDHRWRQAGVIVPPPHLLAVYWFFRDNCMLELVGEALFPVMPAGRAQVGETWEAEIPADIPLAARLNSCLRWSLCSVTDDDPVPAEVWFEAKGTVRLADLPMKDTSPGIRPYLKSGTHNVEAKLCPATGTFQQSSSRLIDVELILTPPSGKERLRTTIHQERRLTAQRGPARRP